MHSQLAPGISGAYVRTTCVAIALTMKHAWTFSIPKRYYMNSIASTCMMTIHTSERLFLVVDGAAIDQ